MAYIDEISQDQGGHGHSDQGQNSVNDKPKQVIVQFNSNSVTLDEKVMTGTEIKQAAIAQGQQVQPDFVLQLQRPNGEYDVIGDSDEVRIRKDMDFTCIAPDDNS
jgi:hypothetical protein